MSITAVKDKINSVAALVRLGIVANVYARSSKFYPDGTPINGMVYGDVYSLRLTSSYIGTMIELANSTPSILDDLGFASTTPVNVTAPTRSFGSDGDFAVDVVSTDENGIHYNTIWQKISLVTVSGTTSWWFKVGSTDASNPGWGWREATPRVITGSVPNPKFKAEEMVEIAVDGGEPFYVTVPGTEPDAAITLDAFVEALNSAFNDNAINVLAKKNTVGNNSYLQIVNYDGTDTWLHDISLTNGTKHPFKDAGIVTSQSFFGSVTGTVANPEFNGGSTMTINIGGSDVFVTMTGATLDSLIGDINSKSEFESFVSAGLMIASKVVVGNNEYLKISNPNGTTFTLKDIAGTPLNTAGIPVGVTFGKKLVYKGYSPSLTVPSTASDLAVDNIWINTSIQNRGASFVVKQYQNGTWVKMNTSPNTATIPMYRDTASADTGFGAAKGYGTIFVQYNIDGTDPVEATHKLMIWDGTAWDALDYAPGLVAPVGAPTAGTLWYNTDFMVDIMVSNGQTWQGYCNVYPGTDPNGPILDASEPLKQSDNTPLVDYDIWVDTSDIENYPKIYRYSTALQSWTLIDNTDHSSAAGIIFSDARSNATGLKNGSTSSAVMALSDYVDPDCPDAHIYPDGLLLFNTRYSTNNVKVWTPKYLPNAAYKDRWVTASGNKPDGTPYMGHWAQRNIVVEALKSVIVSNQDVRAEEAFFNLIACPGYTETLSEMVALNTDKKEIAFIIGDTPARLSPDSTSIQRWATDANKADMDGPDGLITRNDYAGIYYPWGLGTNLDGSSVFIPPSVMALRTYAYNDQIAYPWFAPAGFNRGMVTGVSSVGYLTSQSTYMPLTLSQQQRDVLYSKSINPIASIPNRGLVIYGQKTLSPTSSAMDRVNVARLINYLKYELDALAKPYLFEPNDSQTREAVTVTFTGLMSNLVGARALYDFAVVCDESNNTAEKIDRNELWIDIAIKPEKAIEFIYIPIRLLNTSDPLPGANRI
jgi:hypothetical protein